MKEKFEKIKKFFVRRAYLQALGIGLTVFLFVGSLFLSHLLTIFEEYFSALVVQYGFETRSDLSRVTVIKKDQVTSELLGKNPGRREFASLFECLGQSQLIKTGQQKKPQSFVLFKLDVGLFRDVKSYPVFTSYDFWCGFEGYDDKDGLLGQDRWISPVRRLGKRYRADKNLNGNNCMFMFKENIWGPMKMNFFKVLSGSSDNLILPTLITDWGDKELPAAISKYHAKKRGEGSGDETDSKHLATINLLEKWVSFFESLYCADFVPIFYFYGSSESVFSLSFVAKTKPLPNEYVVEPAAVLGFDFVLQGEMNTREDTLLAETLDKSRAKIVLAGHTAEEEVAATAEEGRDTDKVSRRYSENEKTDGVVVTRTNATDLNQTLTEIRYIMPHDKFLSGKNVSTGIINVGVSNKGFVSEVPLFFIDQKCGKLMPAFCLKIAMLALDRDCKDEEGYVEAMEKEFERIYQSVVDKTFVGPLTIKDRVIPVDRNGFMHIDFVGSTSKAYGVFSPVLDGLSLYECFDREYLSKLWAERPTEGRLNPALQQTRVLNQNINKGNIIAVCGPFEITDFDYFATPLTLNTSLQPIKEDLMGVEIHANAIINILDKLYIKKPGNPASTILALLFVCVVTAVLLELARPVWGAVLTILLMWLTFLYGHHSYHINRELLFMAPLIISFPMIWVATTLLNYMKQRAKAKNTRAMFSRFVSADVVQYMLDNPELVRPGGEKTELTIMFSDIAGFTPMSEALTPEELVVLLNEYLGAMTDLLFKHGGTLDKFIGDAIMAFWNYPRKQPDHAVRACLCAIEMQQKIDSLQVGWQARGLPRVAVRVGINSAGVVVGYMGSNQAQMNFTCMGDGVNLASRLEGANKEYGTKMMISETTYLQVKDKIACRFLDFLAVKGKTEPVKVYQLISEKGKEPADFDEHFELYDRAIKLHLERKWDEAIELFEIIIKKWPDDVPSKTYISRCKQYKETPPPDDWDGRYILTHK
ncbi:MAG: adenylate/guanylate cyclase domain-containing protein [Candidatus Riflebacteria bacterium]|nr:adenylate/guanylate cyclase domain-containing protein [Candidatus Riflebacteria bacterium]